MTKKNEYFISTRSFRIIDFPVATKLLPATIFNIAH